MNIYTVTYPARYSNQMSLTSQPTIVKKEDTLGSAFPDIQNDYQS